ncbi:MAG: polysaccharide pyruvyl transferase family protein [Lachnospiraceae bacterium]|nr:polysaccharide pyruvyl transferase family protein [Lachnospiraceae bacterium]
MKRIGIVTLSNSINYGGVLQSVALSKKLRALGMEGVNITCQIMTPSWKSPIKYVQNRKNSNYTKGIKNKLRTCGGFVKTLLSNIHYFALKKKETNFKGFIRQNMICTPYYRSEELQKFCGDYDGYITGSDQVWNNQFTNGTFKEAYFLAFAPADRPCFSYAASAGGEKSDEYIKEIIDRTKTFCGISVREKSLEEHMRKLGCKNVQTVLDPTLMLSKEEWKKMEKKPSYKLPKNYILVYFLDRKSSYEDVARKVSKELGLPIVDIMPGKKGNLSTAVCDKTAGPAEFLYYVNHAEYIVTNSFHMTVFSLLYQKKFLALQRTGQESRISDLLRMVNMDSHEINDPEQWITILESIPDIHPRISSMYLKSLNFLEQIREQV